MTADRSSANVSQGRIGRLWGGNTGRSILQARALRTPCRFVFDKHRLLRSGIFSLLRRQGFSLSPERYLRRPLSSPVQILPIRNGTAIHHGRSLPRPLSVVNNNTSSHKVLRHRQTYQQFNQQFIRQWHYHRRLSFVSRIGLAAPVMRGIAALHLLQGQRDVLRTVAHAQGACSSLFVHRDGRFSPDEGLSAAGAFAGIVGSVTRTLYKHNSVARSGLPFARPRISYPAGIDTADHGALRVILNAYASARCDMEDVLVRPAFPESNPAFRFHAARLTAPLLRIARLGISARLPAIATAARGPARRWWADATHNVRGHQSLFSSIAQLSPLSYSPVSRPRSSSAAKRLLRSPPGVARLVSARNKDAYSGKRSGFILAARDSAGLAGLVVSMRERMSRSGVLDIVTNEILPGSLLSRRQSVASTGHGRLMQQQRMRAQHAIVELSRGREQQQQESRRRDERVFNELRQQLQVLQRNSSNEQAALLKAVQSLERVLTQTLKQTPAAAIRPLSFMGNR